MLIDFKVENFMSIKQSIKLSQIATNDDTYLENLHDFNNNKLNLKLLPFSCIYGYNSAGKSNILKAITIFKDQISKSNLPEAFLKVNNLKKLDYRPFKLDKSCSNKPTKFEIRFILNELIYKYGYSYNSSSIVDEYLYLYRTNRPTKVFNRNLSKIDWNNELISSKDTSFIDDKINDETLTLSLAGNLNFDYLGDVFYWIQNNIHFLPSNIEGGPFLEKTIEYISDENSHFYKLFKTLLNKTSFDDIEKINAEKIIKTVSEDDIPEIIRTQLLRDILKKDLHSTDSTIKSVQLTVNILRKNVDNEDTIFNIEEESEGTIKLFSIIGTIYEALSEGKVLLVDEITSKLHPFLSRDLVNLFLDKQVNSHGQLICTTHASELLELLDLRRDQVFIVDKNNGETTLHSLSDIKNVRKDENFRAAYLSGKYGGISTFNKIGDNI